jgi:folate-binding protein YgfZ
MALLLDEFSVVRRPAGVVRVTGPDRLSYVHTLLSQHLEDARPGDVADFLYLDAKGNARAVGRAVVRPDDVLLCTPPELGGDLTAALEQYKFLLQVEAADASAAFALASVRGAGAAAVDGAPGEPMRAALDGDVAIVRDRSGGVDLLGPADAVAQRVASLGLPEADADAWEAWRVSAGEAAWGAELAEGRRAQELGLLPTHVHLRKGCYPGQESIAKIYNLGRPRRALAVCEFSAPVAPGDPVDADGKRGEITSAVQVGPAWIALALVPIDADGQVRGGGALDAGGVPGQVRKRVGEGLPQPGAAVG